MTRFHFNATPIEDVASNRRMASRRYIALRTARELGMPVRVGRWMPTRYGEPARRVILTALALIGLAALVLSGGHV